MQAKKAAPKTHAKTKAAFGNTKNAQAFANNAAKKAAKKTVKKKAK